MNGLLKGIYSLWEHMRSTRSYIGRRQKIQMPEMDYNQYWRARSPHTLQPRYRMIAKIIDAGSSVLDVGCGEGLLLEYLTQAKGIFGYGVDISQEAIKLTRGRGVRAETANILDWSVDQDYDYIILSEVLEHLADPEKVIATVSERFRKALIVSIPNIGYYQHRLRLLCGRFPVQWTWHPAEHLRFWTVVDFVEWIKELGLEVADIRSSNGFPLLHHYLPNLLGNQVVFVIIRPPQMSKHG
jgi:methionine biosynthesis protein MetW